MSYFTQAPPDVEEMLEELLIEYGKEFPYFHATKERPEPMGRYDEIRDLGIKIDLLMAYGVDDAPAIMHQGRQARGLFKVRNLELRASGLGDCLIMLDGDWWKSSDTTDDERRALLDHELFHLQIKRKDGDVVRDDLNRVKITARPHSFEVGWFAEIGKRHGSSSQEVQQARNVLEKGREYFWPGLDAYFAEQGEFMFHDVKPRRGLVAFDAGAIVEAATAGDQFRNFVANSPGITSVTISGGGKSVTFGGDKNKVEPDDEHEEKAASKS